MGANFAAPFALLRPVDVDPLKYAEQYQNLANLAQLRQYRQQEMASQAQLMQENALKIQEMQQGLQDQQTMQAELSRMRNDPQYRTPEGKLDMDKVTDALESSGKVRPSTVEAFRKVVLGNADTASQVTLRNSQAREADQKAAESKRVAAEAFTNHMGNVAQDLLDLPDNGATPALAIGMFHHARDLWGDTPEHQQAFDTAEQEITQNPDSIRDILSRYAGFLTPEQREARAKVVTEGLTQAAKKAETAKNQAEADKLGYELTWMKQAGNADPAAGDAIIDQILPPDKFQTDNPNFKAQLRTAGSGMTDMNQAARARSEVIQQARELASGRSPEANRAAATRAAEIKRAEAPIEQANAAALARAMAGGVGEYANVPPKDIDKVRADYLKSGQGLINAAAAADEMQDFIDMARSGNKVAYAYAPTTGVLTINSANGTKRMNMAEVSQYMKAGSDWDKVQQFFGSHLTGQSIDKDILNAMEQTHQGLFQSQQQKHANEVTAINKAYNATLKPMDIKPKGPTQSGKVYTQADVDAAVAQHPGLTAAAAESAFKAKGWVKK